MPDEETSRRSSRRRGRRRSRRPPRDDVQQEERSPKTKEGRGKHRRSAEAQDELPDVFIYTYTIYKSGD